MGDEENSIVIAEFIDGTKLIYSYAENGRPPYVVIMNGHTAEFETECSAIQYLISCGYYKADENKRLLRNDGKG